MKGDIPFRFLQSRPTAYLLGFLVLGWQCARTGMVLAATYYVAPGGDDGGPGTLEKPFATLQKAADTAQAGDEVVVREGTYAITREVRPRNSGTSERWIVYRAMPGEKAVLDADGFTTSGPEDCAAVCAANSGPFIWKTSVTCALRTSLSAIRTLSASILLGHRLITSRLAIAALTARTVRAFSYAAVPSTAESLDAK